MVCTFGGELAVEQMLPAYFEKMFGVSVAIAGVMGAGFAFANFIARPLGGILGDHLGRKPIMIVTLAGSALGFFLIPHDRPALAALGSDGGGDSGRPVPDGRQRGQLLHRSIDS